jgi:Protein of unknown function (DUF3306)
VSNELSATLARWSRRKLGARRSGGALAATVTKVRPDGEKPTPQRDRKETLAEASEENHGAQRAHAASAAGKEMPVLPSIDELDAQSDYTLFLAKDVPEALARAALRKLWTSDPILANLDGLNNYDEDYNLVDTAITAAQTSYKVGLGYLDEVKNELAQLDESVAPHESVAPRGEVRAEPLADSGMDDANANAGAAETRDEPEEKSADAPRQAATDEDRISTGEPLADAANRHQPQGSSEG